MRPMAIVEHDTLEDKAFSQIRAKGYAEPYLADGRPIWLIGLSFDSSTRRLADYAAERCEAA